MDRIFEMSLGRDKKENGTYMMADLPWTAREWEKPGRARIHGDWVTRTLPTYPFQSKPSSSMLFSTSYLYTSDALMEGLLKFN